MAQSVIIMIIIMYIYHALINALSAHMIHINLNMIFYTHAEHVQSYQNNLHKVLYGKTNKHTHTHDCSRVWKKGVVKQGLECATDHYVHSHFFQCDCEFKNMLLCHILSMSTWNDKRLEFSHL